MIDTLLLFGASGDLAGRLLLPALAALHAAGRLPEGLTVVGAASEDWDDETFRQHVARRLEEHAATPVVDAWAKGTPPLLEYPAGSSGPSAL